MTIASMKKGLQIFKLFNQSLTKPYLKKLSRLKKYVKNKSKRKVDNLYLLDNEYEYDTKMNLSLSHNGTYNIR